MINKDIRNTWPRSMLKHCLAPSIPSTQRDLNCFIHQFGFEQLFVEVLNRHPPIIRLPDFLGEDHSVESMGVEGLVYSTGHRGRQADGLWLSHEEKEIRPLYRTLRKTLALNPAMGEDFLILSYQQFGHYAPHFDHLEPMPVEYDDGWFAYFGNRLATAFYQQFGHYAPHFDHLEPMPVEYDDGWFAYFGNRLATALLIVRTAKGSFTTFPNLNLTVGPERGDLLLWLNSNSNGKREQNALHAACPIIEGRKIANALKCSLNHPSYEPEDLIKRIPYIYEGPEERPDIPSWVLK
uniref:Prolyl 4-hydroxylase alpha subunit domain-containing protein n=1 Tax=Meloidogyne floridensis TaxID=298350 RepID=A0A915NPY0_9BILA